MAPDNNPPPETPPDIIDAGLSTAMSGGEEISSDDAERVRRFVEERWLGERTKELEGGQEARLQLLREIGMDARKFSEHEQRLDALASLLLRRADLQAFQQQWRDRKVKFKYRSEFHGLAGPVGHAICPERDELIALIDIEILQRIPADASPDSRRAFLRDFNKRLSDELQSRQGWLTALDRDDIQAAYGIARDEARSLASRRGITLLSETAAAQAAAAAAPAEQAAPAAPTYQAGDQPVEQAEQPAADTYKTSAESYIAHLPQDQQQAQKDELARICAMPDGDDKTSAFTALLEGLHEKTATKRASELKARLDAEKQAGTDTSALEQELTQAASGTAPEVFTQLDAVEVKINALNPWPAKKKILEAYIGFLTGQEKTDAQAKLAELESKTGPERMTAADAMLTSLHEKVVKPRIAAIEKVLKDMPDSDDKTQLTAELQTLKDATPTDAIRLAQALYQKVFPPATADPTIQRLAEYARKNGGLAASIHTLILLLAKLDISFGNGSPIFFDANTLAGLGFTQDPNGKWLAPQESQEQGPQTPEQAVAARLKTECGLTDDELTDVKGATVEQIASGQNIGTHLIDADKIRKVQGLVLGYAGKTDLSQLDASINGQQAFTFMVEREQERQAQQQSAAAISAASAPGAPAASAPSGVAAPVPASTPDIPPAAPAAAAAAAAASAPPTAPDAAPDLQARYFQQLEDAARPFIGRTTELSEDHPIQFQLPYIEGSEIKTVSCSLGPEIAEVGGNRYKIELPMGAELKSVKFEGTAQSGTVTLEAGVGFATQERSVPTSELFETLHTLRRGISTHTLDEATFRLA